MQRPGREAGPRTQEPALVDRSADLELMRRRLLDALDAVAPDDVPRITRELRAVDLELTSLAPPVSPGQRRVDELKARRDAARRTAT